MGRIRSLVNLGKQTRSKWRASPGRLIRFVRCPISGAQLAARAVSKTKIENGMHRTALDLETGPSPRTSNSVQAVGMLHCSALKSQKRQSVFAGSVKQISQWSSERDLARLLPQLHGVVMCNTRHCLCCLHWSGSLTVTSWSAQKGKQEQRPGSWLQVSKACTHMRITLECQRNSDVALLISSQDTARQFVHKPEAMICKVPLGYLGKARLQVSATGQSPNNIEAAGGLESRAVAVFSNASCIDYKPVLGRCPWHAKVDDCGVAFGKWIQQASCMTYITTTRMLRAAPSFARPPGYG